MDAPPRHTTLVRDGDDAPLLVGEQRDTDSSGAFTRTAEKKRRWDSARSNALLAGVVVGCIVAVWQTRGAWGPRAPAGEDVMANLVRLDFAVPHLVEHVRLDGWFPRFYLGYQEFLFNGPGVAWCVAFARFLTFGALSITGAFKVVTIAAFGALPAAVAFAARGLGLGRRAAGLAAILCLLVSNVFGVGLQATYIVGLVAQQIGAVFFFLALGAVVRIPVDARARWILLAGVAGAALAVTHVLSLLVLGLVLLLCVVPLAARRELGWPALRRLALAVAVGVGVGGWWIIPFVAHNDLQGNVATWGTPPLFDRVDDIFSGHILFRAGTAMIVVAAWGWSVWRASQRRRLALTVALLPAAYVAVAHVLATNQLPTFDTSLQFANRGLGYAGILAVLPLAALLAAATRLLARVTARGALAYAVGIAAAVGLVLSGLGPDQSVPKEFANAIPEMSVAARALRQLVPAGARFATERDYPGEIQRTGVVHPETWLARASGRNSLNGWNLESSTAKAAPFAPDDLGRKPAPEVADELARLGVTDVVTTSDATAAQLAASPRFRERWHEEPLRIFDVLPATGQSSPSSLVWAATPIAAHLDHAQAQRLVITTQANQATSVSVAVAWSPKWHASIDGRETTVQRGFDSIIELRVPRGGHRIELEFRSDGWDWLGRSLTVITLLAIAGWLMRRRRRRVNGAETPQSGEFAAYGPQ